MTGGSGMDAVKTVSSLQRHSPSLPHHPPSSSQHHPSSLCRTPGSPSQTPGSRTQPLAASEQCTPFGCTVYANSAVRILRPRRNASYPHQNNCKMRNFRTALNLQKNIDIHIACTRHSTSQPLISIYLNSGPQCGEHNPPSPTVADEQRLSFGIGGNIAGGIYQPVEVLQASRPSGHRDAPGAVRGDVHTIRLTVRAPVL